ncbi:hypothetical protein Gotri_013700, partial [Gossypium trilobum]|nr:hypothetical protein [Gossypium trilobum]
IGLKIATYTPKNILITGAASFIASYVANRLIQNYLSYKIVGDIASAGLVNYLLVAESIDTIMHFAAQIHRFIHVSTDEVYGETDEDAIVGNHEASQLLPTNPYSQLKLGRLFQFMGDGSNVRSYLHCEDVSETFEVILHKGEVGHVYNVRTKKEMRGIDVAKDICKLFSMDPETNIQTGWIGGILDQLCEKHGIPFKYGRGRLKNRASLMADIQNIKPTHVFNVIARFSVMSKT